MVDRFFAPFIRIGVFVVVSETDNKNTRQLNMFYSNKYCIYKSSDVYIIEFGDITTDMLFLTLIHQGTRDC